jgi:hypothetical protein
LEVGKIAMMNLHCCYSEKLPGYLQFHWEDSAILVDSFPEKNYFLQNSLLYLEGMEFPTDVVHIHKKIAINE